MIQLMSDDPEPDTPESFRDRVIRYRESGSGHREQIPFLFLEEYSGDLPDKQPSWIREDPKLDCYWKIARSLSELYSYPLQRSFGRRTRLLDHADHYREASKKPDHRLWELSDRTDLSYKDWCRKMETYLGERTVKTRS